MKRCEIQTQRDLIQTELNEAKLALGTIRTIVAANDGIGYQSIVEAVRELHLRAFKKDTSAPPSKEPTYKVTCESLEYAKDGETLIQEPEVVVPDKPGWKLVGTSVGRTHLFWTWENDRAT